jgi:hypothetical protein
MRHAAARSSAALRAAQGRTRYGPPCSTSMSVFPRYFACVIECTTFTMVRAPRPAPRFSGPAAESRDAPKNDPSERFSCKGKRGLSGLRVRVVSLYVCGGVRDEKEASPALFSRRSRGVSCADISCQWSSQKRINVVNAKNAATTASNYKGPIHLGLDVHTTTSPSCPRALGGA